MSDYELPELPSDEELGITDEDRRKYGEDLPDDAPELSQDEVAALLGSTAGRDPGEGGRAEDGEAARERPQEPPGPRSRWRGPVTLVVLLAVSVVSSSRTGQPRPGPANTPDTAFSSARAMSMLVDIARRPRPIGSPEHTRVRELLLERLRALGLEPQVHTATAMGQVTGTEELRALGLQPGADTVGTAQVTGIARAATVRNIVARLPGTDPTGAVLITAHYDSRELAPGAADDGAGVVMILEAVRALQAGPALRNDIIVLITDGEEPCLCGAQAFVDQHPWIDDVSVVLSFEMRGAGGLSIMFETKEESGWVVRALEQLEPPPFANSMAYEVYRRMPNNTDFTKFREAGKQGLNFAAIDRAHVYHQASDRPENLSESTLQHHGLSGLTLLRHFGDSDLSSVNAPDAVYFTVPLLGLVIYDGRWVLPITGALLALAIVAWLLARTGGARPSGLMVGLGVSILGAALSFGVGLWLHTWITRLHPEAGSIPGSLAYSEGWWVLTAAAVTFSVVVALHQITRRWLTSVELSLGATVVPFSLAIAASLSVPLGAMNLQWPLAAALLAIVVVGLLRRRAGGTVGWLATLALAVPVLSLLVPVLELVWLAMSVQVVALLAVLMAVTLYLCLPALDSLRHPNSWWAPLTGVIAAAGCFGMAVLSSRPNADRPAPSTLAYAYEHGTGSGLWITDPNADPVLDAEAIGWAAERAGASFSRTLDVSDFGYPPGPTPVADARLINVPPPTVQILADSIEGPVRNVSLAVRSNLGAEVLRFQIDPAGQTRILSLNGTTIEEPDSLDWAEHYGEPEGDGVLLELRMPADEPIGLDVIEHFLRPRELLGPAPFERPDDLMPDVNAMSDRAAFLYSVAVYADPRHPLMPDASAPPPMEPAAADEPPDPAPAAPNGQAPDDTTAVADSVS